MKNQSFWSLHLNFDSSKHAVYALKFESFFLKTKFLRHHRLVFFPKILHRKQPNFIREQERNMNYFDWSIKILIVRIFQKVFYKSFNSKFKRIFSLTTGWKMVFSQETLNWKLHVYSVGSSWKIKFSMTALKFQQWKTSRKGHSDWVMWDLSVDFLRRHRLDSYEQVLKQKLRNCIGEQERKIKSSDWSLNICRVG